MKAFLCAGASCEIAKACHRGVLDGCPCLSSPATREDDTTYLYTCNDNVNFSCGVVEELCGTEPPCSVENLVSEWNCRIGLDVSFLGDLCDSRSLSLSLSLSLHTHTHTHTHTHSV